MGWLMVFGMGLSVGCLADPLWWVAVVTGCLRSNDTIRPGPSRFQPNIKSERKSHEPHSRPVRAAPIPGSDLRVGRRPDRMVVAVATKTPQHRRRRCSALSSTKATTKM